jgi:hypothetical protein
LLGYSQSLGVSPWVADGATATANSTTAPDGTTTASLVTGTSGNYRIYQQAASTIGFNYTISFYAKEGTSPTLRIDWINIAVGPVFTFSTGTFSVVAGYTTTVENVGDGWYRLSVTRSVTNANPGPGFVVSGATTVYLWGVQYEVGSTPTDYQPITDWNTEFKAAYPTHSLYVDSNGVAPAVYPGDQVGLILDTAKGGLDSLGSDLVSNGTFATDTVWSKGANWTIGSGVATKTGGAANNLTQTITSTAGLWYRITMDVTRTAGTLTVSLGTSGTTYAITATGTYTFFIVAGSSTQTLTLAGDSSFAGTVDNVTARLVPGNHAYQTTSGSRPALARTPDGGRRNLLTFSEDISNVIWVGYQVTKSSTGFLETAATDEHAVSQNLSSGDGSVAFTITAELKGVGGRTWCRVRSRNTGFSATAGGYFELSGAGSVGNTANTNASFVTRTITSIADGWYRIVISGITHNAGHTSGIGVSITSAGGNGTASFAGDIAQGLSIRNVQLEVGSSATAYQKVTLTSDVTESGKRDCWGLLFDGSDDSLQTASVDFSTTDKMTVMAGVGKLSSSAGNIVELGINFTSNTGSMYLWSGNDPTDRWWSASRGSQASNGNQVANVNVPSPDTAVISSTHDIAGDSTTIRRNGVADATATGEKGSANFRSDILYIGSRGGSSVRYNGLIYTLIIRGATTPTGTIADFERNLLARRCGVTF